MMPKFISFFGCDPPDMYLSEMIKHRKKMADLLYGLLRKAKQKYDERLNFDFRLDEISERRGDLGFR